MQHIHEAQHAIVFIPTAVMNIVIIRLLVKGSDPREAKIGMMRLGAEGNPPHPPQHKHNMRTEQQKSNSDWDKIPHNQFDRVTVQSRKPKRRPKFMVLFVNSPIQVRVGVKIPMDVIKGDFKDREVTRHEPRQVLKCWQLLIEYHAILPPRPHSDTHQEKNVRKSKDTKLADGDRSDREDVLGTVAVRLKLIRST